MGKITNTLIALVGALAIAPAASAATPTPTLPPVTIPAVTGVSATWANLEGFIVDWVPVTGASRNLVRSYTVTSSGGQTCTAPGSDTAECVFSTNKIPFTFKSNNRYTFTVVANGVSSVGPQSAPSNAAGMFGPPVNPGFVVAKTISDSQIDVKWVPDVSTGGVPLNKYKVWYWPLGRDNEQKMIPSLDNSVSITGLEKSTWYVISVQSCNYYGCSTSDWAYQATTPVAPSTSTWLLPRTLNGGSASTTCWDYVIDGGSVSSTAATVTKSSAACPVPTAPSSWPVVNPAATGSPNLPIATKFNPRTSFSLANASYSMAYKWNDLGIYSGNFTRTRSLAPRTYESLTPQVCTIGQKNGEQVAHFVAAGTCTIRMTIAADETYLASGPLTASFVVKP